MSESMQENPFQSPMYTGVQTGRRNPVSGFYLGWVITDLVFCGLRIPLLFFSVLGALALTSNNPLAPTAAAELISGVGICLLGIVANILLLMRKPIGVTIGWLAIVCVLLSIVVSFWQISIQAATVTDAARKAGMMVGVAFAVMIRVVLNAVYAFVLVGIRKRFAEQAPVFAETV